MGKVIVVTVAEEGGLYSPDKSASAPIRVYSDRWIEDDIILRILGRKRRERLSRKAFRWVRRHARENRRAGLV